MQISLYTSICVGIFIFITKPNPEENYRVQYENGEEELVEVKRLAPDGDFLSPQVGEEVCCTAKGGRYTAVILDIVDPAKVSLLVIINVLKFEIYFVYMQEKKTRSHQKYPKKGNKKIHLR